MITKYIAFLRGINAGRVIKMDELQSCLGNAGLKNIRTVLQTGNVIFESVKTAEELQKIIEKNMSDTFDYEAHAQVLAFSVLKKIVDNYPFKGQDKLQHDYVIFMENGLEAYVLKEDYVLGDNEKVKGGDGVIYWRVNKGATLNSNFAKVLSKPKYRLFNTNRNLNTLNKILDK